MPPPVAGSRAAAKPEWEVLVAGARTHLSAADRSRLLHALTAPIDWEQLLALAFHHDLAPLLLHALETIDSTAAVPVSSLKNLQRARAAYALRSTLLFEELACLLDWAQRRRIEVIALKGAALAESVYGDRVLRPMRDIDLLVRPAHVAGVEQFLASRGYGLNREWARAEAWHRRHDYHLAYRRQPDGLPALCIELHWHLVIPSWTLQPDLDGIRRRAVPATIAGVEAKALSPEDTLLYLCLHACKHGLTAGLRPFCDIAEVVRHHSGRIDWTAVIRRALEWRTPGFTCVPLMLAHDLLGAPVPEAVFEDFGPTSFDRRVAGVASRTLAEHPRDASLSADFVGLTWSGSMAERKRVLRKVFARDVVAARSGVARESGAIWLQYPLRLGRLCRSYGPEFWRFLRSVRRATAHAEERSLLAQFLRPLESMQRPSEALPQTVEHVGSNGFIDRRGGPSGPPWSRPTSGV